MVYLDSDARAKRSFGDGTAQEIVNARRSYKEASRFEFVDQDYSLPLPIEDESVDLLISQYAGFVSDSCARYLKPGGYLIANNSHGDAGLAHSDRAFELIAVVNRRGERYSFKTADLDQYFSAKTQSLPTDSQPLREYLKDLGRDVGYTKTASDYVFRKRH